MDEERKKKSEEEIVLQKELDAYAVDEVTETFAAEIADKEDNPRIKKTKTKSMYELCKEFLNKSYRELEKYRDSDRQEEANEVPLTEAQRNLVEHVEAGACIMGEMRKDREFDKEIDYHRYWKDMYDKEHKLRQEAEGELTILKGIETNRVKEAQDALANALEVNESHQKLNGKLQLRVTELEEEIERTYEVMEHKLHRTRKAGL